MKVLITAEITVPTSSPNVSLSIKNMLKSWSNWAERITASAKSVKKQKPNPVKRKKMNFPTDAAPATVMNFLKRKFRLNLPPMFLM